MDPNTEILVITSSTSVIMPLYAVCSKYSMTAAKVAELIESGGNFSGVYFDEPL